MKKQMLLFQTALLTFVGLGLFAPTFARADAPFIQYSEAEGDGDPTELTVNETISDADADDVATLTAEGDFLVPTYLLPTERAAARPAEATIATPMSSAPRTATPGAPVVVVSGAQITPAEMPLASSTTVTTRPIGASTGSAATPGAVTVAPTTQPRTVAASAPKPVTTTTVTTRIVEIEDEKPSESKKQLLLPLAPVPEVSKDTSPDVRLTARRVVPSDYADRMLADLNKNQPAAFKLPQEIRVTFYKNSTAISGQTLKWIRAFALQTIQDPRMAVEIRMSREDPAIQTQRFAIIRNALLGTGLSTHQIQLVYTGRSADSFVLRAAERPENVDILQKTNGSGKVLEKRTVKW